MEPITSILEGLWIGISPYIGYVIFSLFLILISDILYVKLRGKMGEFWVNRELEKLDYQDYILLKDIMIETDRGTHQIDHIVVSQKGIFVIETKNYHGLIVGGENSSEWSQISKGKKYYFKNPFYQNYGHIKSLSEKLNLPENFFINVVCFSNQAKLNAGGKGILTQVGIIKKHIEEFETDFNLDFANISNSIKNINITDRKQRKQHVANIRNNVALTNELIDKNICPKCNGQLIERNGKYGSFYGCSNYPKCNYTKKI